MEADGLEEQAEAAVTAVCVVEKVEKVEKVGKVGNLVEKVSRAEMVVGVEHVVQLYTCPEGVHPQRICGANTVPLR